MGSKSEGKVREALERVLSHAESHGEAYPGAVDDHAAIRGALSDSDRATDERLQFGSAGSDEGSDEGGIAGSIGGAGSTGNPSEA